MPLVPRRRRSRLTRVWLRAGLAATLLAVLAWTPAAEAGGATSTEACFLKFAHGWRARNPTDITRCMPPKGTLSIRLFGYPFSGRGRVMGPEQARETLKTYFKKVTLVQLKDVTPKKSPRNVRLYQYTYKAIRENARTTHLQVKLKQDKKRLWVLASVTEARR